MFSVMSAWLKSFGWIFLGMNGRYNIYPVCSVGPLVLRRRGSGKTDVLRNRPPAALQQKQHDLTIPDQITHMFILYTVWRLVGCFYST